MSDKPILFSSPMVRALLDGRKTQTRRILRPDRVYDDIASEAAEDYELRGWNTFYRGDALCAAKPSYAPGDRLWVRESGELFREAYDYLPAASADLWRDAGWRHSADGDLVPARKYDPPLADWLGDCSVSRRPSIHMPRWASRLTLIVTDVRVQRLQEINPHEARCEGVTELRGGWWSAAEGQSAPDPRAAFALLWNNINGPGAWDANPWVAAYSFRVIKSNIDQLQSEAAA